MKCTICEKEKSNPDVTQYKFKLICRDCITFFKHTVIFYGNSSAWVANAKKKIEGTVDYALNGIDNDD